MSEISHLNESDIKSVGMQSKLDRIQDFCKPPNETLKSSDRHNQVIERNLKTLSHLAKILADFY